jgi:hypothetical protein
VIFVDERNNFHFWNISQNSTDFELHLKFLFKFEIQKSWVLRDILHTIANTSLYQTGQGVFKTRKEVFLFHPVDMHTPSPKIKVDIEFSKVLNV